MILIILFANMSLEKIESFLKERNNEHAKYTFTKLIHLPVLIQF